jgi:hypothetical protein
MPEEGGKPEAIAMPKHKGKAIKKTKKPESKSPRQCAFKPAKPVAGKVAFETFIKTSPSIHRFKIELLISKIVIKLNMIQILSYTDNLATKIHQLPDETGKIIE